MPIEKTNTLRPNDMPRTVVDKDYDRAARSFDVVEVRTVGTIELGAKGVPAVEAAFRLIGRTVLAGGSPRVEESSTFSFSYGGEQFEVTVNVKDA